MSRARPVGVWIAENPSQGISRPGAFKACVLELHVDGKVLDMLEDATLDECLDWARARSEVILVRPAGIREYHSAGTKQPPWGPLPSWPPVADAPRAEAADPPRAGAADSEHQPEWTIVTPFTQSLPPDRIRTRDPQMKLGPNEAVYEDENVIISVLSPFPPWDQDQDPR